MALLTVDKALRSLLMADATVADLVSGRIYPGRAPKGAAFPLVVYEEVAGTGHANLSGAATLEERAVQLAIYATDHNARVAVSKAAKDRLHGYKGAVAIGSDSVTFDGIFYEDGKDAHLEVANANGSSQPLYCREDVYRVFTYTE